MKIKMLESMAGKDFSLSVGDVTDRFTKNEAGRFIKAGIAEAAPPDPVKKPETKKEWDDERDKLLEEVARLAEEAAALKRREEELQAEVASLAAFKAAVVEACQIVAPAIEKTEVPADLEKRG